MCNRWDVRSILHCEQLSQMKRLMGISIVINWRVLKEMTDRQRPFIAKKLCPMELIHATARSRASQPVKDWLQALGPEAHCNTQCITQTWPLQIFMCSMLCKTICLGTFEKVNESMISLR